MTRATDEDRSSVKHPARARSVPPLLDADLVVRRVRVRARDAVFVKGVLEASEGVAVMFAQRGGELAIAAPRSREACLDELVADLVAELEGVIENDSL